VKPPSSALALDAAVLVAAARGRSSGAILEAARAAVLVTTDRAVHEARRRVGLRLRRPDLLPVLDALIAEIAVVPVAALQSTLARSEVVLREAVASRNGSTDDAHMLALAWSVEADIWTSDRDFAGTGVATWSTPNLMRGIADAGRRGGPPVPPT
jgi:predicted nucleic acid-binding protein